MDRTLPSNIEAERATLGALLSNREAIIAVDDWLEPGAFYLHRHTWVYEAIQACYRRQVPPDLSTVSDELRRVGRLEDIGGLGGLIELVNSAPSSAHIVYYARIVERTAVHRRVIVAGGKITALAYDERDDLDSLATDAQMLLNDALLRRSESGFTDMRTLAGRLYERLNAGELPGLSTGYWDLDAVLGGGLAGSELILLAARPSVGKTALALCVAYEVAQRGLPVLFFSLEMSADQLNQRLVSLVTELPSQRIRSGRLGDEERAWVMQALDQLIDLPLFIDDTPAQAISTIARKAVLHSATQGKPALVLVDYLQLATATDAKNSREQEVAAISRGLKALAKQLDAPVLALAQLNRAVEGRTSHIPTLADLRESGQLEQDADVVLFLYREELYDRETDKKGIAEVHIAKQRNGPLSVVPLRFDGPTMRFQNLQH